MKTQIKLAIMTALILVSSVACENGGDAVNSAVNSAIDDVNAKTALVEQTITVSSDMIENTVVNGCGAFSNSLPECQ